MKIKYTLLSAILIISLFAFSQNPVQRNCGTPSLPSAFEQWLQGVQSNLSSNPSNARLNYTLPVVIHIIHNGEAVGSGSNISNAQAISQITVLNKDFSATNSDVTSVPSVWTNVVANTQISFCLAQVDPNGNIMAEPGIDRVNRNTRGFTAPPYTQTYTDATIKPATIWNPNQYLNIWCLSLGNSLLGYATFPNPGTSGLAGLPSPYGSNTTDGVVILNTAFGNTGTAAAPYGLGRTATHEIGHWLGLRHIWGDANCGTDYCNDTPTQQTSNFGCPTYPRITCNNSGDMSMNYMDYTNDACMYMFTLNQKDRMQAILAGSPMRINLAASTKCTLPSSLDASVSAILNPLTGSSSCNNSVTPQITLRNSGSTTITSCTITYRMDNGNNQTFNWTGSLASGATTNITLNAFNGLTAGSHTFTAASSSPNGGTDQNTANNSASSTFIVVSGQSLPFTEGFEGATFVPANWNYTPVNTTNKWARVTTASGFGSSTACAKMDNFTGNTNITGQKDIMTTPPISFTGATSTLQLKFDVAYARAANNSNDTLNVYISVNCGTTWTKIYAKGGSTLATAPNTNTAFTPTTTQWRKDSVSLSAYTGQSVAYFRFESVSGSDNNVYLDNININSAPLAPPPVAAITASATAVCVGQTVNLTDASSNNPTSWSWTMTGGAPASATTQNTSVTYNTAGTYTVSLTATNSGGSNTTTRTITVNPLPTLSINTANAAICSGSSATITASGASSYLWNSGQTTASITVSPLTNTTYTVTGTGSNGCTKQLTQSITVNALPVVTINGANTSICIGQSVSLTATGASSYLWNTGATGVTISDNPQSETSYSVTGTDANGCVNTASILIGVNPLPNITISTVNTNVCEGSSVTMLASGGTNYTWSTGETTASVTVAPIVNTTYIVNGNDVNGCSNSASQLINVNPNPIISISGTPSICIGGTALLSASGTSSIVWNSGETTSDITVSPTINTTYSASGTDNNGCTGTADFSVVVNPLPQVFVTTQSDSICSTAGLISLDGVPAGGIYSGTGVNGNSFDPQVSGIGSFTITYSYTDNNNCSNTADLLMLVDACTGIKQNKNLDINIYPNPASSFITIQLPTGLNNSEFTLIDISGKVIRKEKLNKQVQQIDLSNICAGIYLMRINNNENVSSHRIVVD